MYKFKHPMMMPDTGIGGGNDSNIEPENPGFQLDDDSSTSDVPVSDADSSPQGDMEDDGEQGDAGLDEGGDDNTPRYSKSDVSKMIQGRIKEMEKHKKTVERIARQSGISVDEVEHRLNAIEQQKRDQQLEQTARVQGIDPRLLKVLANQHNELSKLKLQSQLSTMRADTKNFPDFSEIEGEVIDKANELNVSLSDAYWMVAGPRRVAQATREGEQRIINHRQKMAGKDRVQGDSSSQMGVSNPKVPDDVRKMAKQVNMDPDEYYALMNAQNIDDWRAYKAKNKK